MSKFQDIANEVRKVISGKDRAIVTVLLALLANGNILIEDIPGVGKTTMAVAFSKALGLSCKRVQFTPDTLPSDISGYSIFDKASNKMRFIRGAVFCNIFLADELNRTSSRTQSALLEAMEEHKVTVDSVTYGLKEPFSVIATQNPVGAAGTQLLPDSQTDRFMVRISMGYPDSSAECNILLNRAKTNPLDKVRQIVSAEEFIQMQNEVKSVFIKREIARYIVSLITATRENPLINRGASPRATISLAEISRAVAYAEGRDYVIPRDIQNIFLNTIAHRIILSGEAGAKNYSCEKILSDIVKTVKQPRI